jgi:thiamine biosynthesis lipoprotein
MGYAWFSAMHTRLDLVMVGPGEVLQRELLRQIHARVMELDGLLNRFSDGSEVAGVNAKAGLEEVTISPDLFELLSYALQACEQTNGLFDITIQSHKQSGNIPDRRIHTNSKLPLNPRAIQLQHNPLRVRFLHPHLQIDLGGLAKGYAVDEVRKLLDTAQVEHYLISFGTSSIAAKGDRPGIQSAGDIQNSRIEMQESEHPPLSPDATTSNRGFRTGWNIALQNGSASYQLIDECLTVSGNDSQPGGHIIDPRTGELVKSTLVAVKTKTAIEGEVLSTVRFISPVTN